MSILGADCHAHLFGHDYPSVPDCDYRPDRSQIGTVDRFLALLDAHGLSHGLVVGPEPYGTVNDCITDGIRAAKGRLKGIALVRPDVDDRELRRLADAGVVGVRYNLTRFGMRQFRHPATTRLFARLKEMGWFLQVHCQNDELAAAAPMLGRSGVRVMIDHFARPDPRKGLEQPGFCALLALGRTDNAVVKLSGPSGARTNLRPMRTSSRTSPRQSTPSRSRTASGDRIGRSCESTSASTMGPSLPV